MRATISYQGKDCLLESIVWNNDDSISHVTFKDGEGNHQIAMRKVFSDVEEGFSPNGLLILDLQKRVKWGE